MPYYATELEEAGTGRVLYQIGDDTLRCCVAPSAGGDLSSLQTRAAAPAAGEGEGGEGDWLELLHRAADFSAVPLEPFTWQGRAPHLFPAVGRSWTAAQARGARRPPSPVGLQAREAHH